MVLRYKTAVLTQTAVRTSDVSYNAMLVRLASKCDTKQEQHLFVPVYTYTSALS
jgi:hypothetical protein